MRWPAQSINRIRLEFKAVFYVSVFHGIPVLIESDWNLKRITTNTNISADVGINRIRLEFKGRMYTNPLRTLKKY